MWGSSSTVLVLVSATENICKIRWKSKTWGSGCILRDKQNSSSKILNESHLPLCWLMMKTQSLPVLLKNMCQNKTTTVNSRGLSVVRTTNVLLIVQQYTMGGSSVAVYWSLERKMYCNCWKHIQCEVPAVRCRFWSLQRKIYAKYIWKSTTWGSGSIRRDEQNGSSKILN